MCYGVLPVKKTINNKFLYRHPCYGWRYFMLLLYTDDEIPLVSLHSAFSVIFDCCSNWYNSLLQLLIYSCLPSAGHNTFRALQSPRSLPSDHCGQLWTYFVSFDGFLVLYRIVHLYIDIHHQSETTDVHQALNEQLHQKYL